MMDSGNNAKRAKLIDGDEVDAIGWSPHHKVMMRPGERARIKRKIRRRERQAAKRELR